VSRRRRHQPVQPAGIQDPPDNLGGDRHPQLRAADRGTLVGAQKSIRATVITRNRPGHIRDQHGGAPVDQFQQLLADLPGIRHADMFRQRHHRLPSRPPNRARAIRHGSNQRIRQGQGTAKPRHHW
jgi:hypothetical protein